MRRFPIQSCLIYPLILLLFCFGSLSIAEIPHYQWRSFSKRDGLVGNRIAAVREDAEGRIWFATDAGVSAFDGLWTSFTSHNGLPDAQATALLQTTDGAMWVGTPGGIAIYRGDRWETQLLPENLQIGQHVLALAEATPGNVWIGTTQGAARYDGSRWDRLPLPDSLQSEGVSAILAEPSGELWLGFLRGQVLMHFVPEAAGQGRWSVLAPGSELPEEAIRVLVRDADGSLWVGTEQGVVRQASGGWEWMMDGARDAYRDADGDLWLATPNGLARYHQGQWDRFGIPDGLASEDCTAVWIDSYRRIWVGTGDRGVSFTDRAWRSWKPGMELPVENVIAIGQDATGAIWAGGIGGVATYRDEAWERVPLPSGTEIRDMTLGSSRRLWLATDSGIALFDGFGWLYHTLDDGLGSNNVYSIMMDSAGRIWAGHGSDAQGGVAGFSWFDGFRWRTITTDSAVTALLEDRRGHFWIGTARHGIKHVPGGPVEEFTISDGLISNEITALAESPDGRIWIGTVNGISLYNAGQWESLTSGQGLIDDRVLCITPVNGDEMWVGTAGGISIYDGDWWSSLTAEDGLPGNRIDQIYETLSGDIWVSGIGGGVSLHRPERIAPRVRIVSGPRGTIGVRAVSFVFEGGDASTSPEQILYSYRLGIEDWSSFSRQTFATFSNLSDGSYTFFVRAQDRALNISRPVQAGFRVDATEPVAVIRSPVEGQVIRGAVEILGTATDVSDFVEYQVEAGPEFVHASPLSVQDGVLAVWDTRDLVDGKYSIRLASWDSVDGGYDVVHTRSMTVGVLVDNTPPKVELLQPEAGKTYQGQVEILGSMIDLHLAEFSLEVSQKNSAGTVVSQVIQAGNTTGQSAQLPVIWDSNNLDGPVDIQLEAADVAGNRQQATTHILLDNASARPQARIVSPVEGTVISGSIDILGTVDDSDLIAYEVAYHQEGNAAWLPIADGTEPVRSAMIARWETETLPDGEYRLRVTATDANGYQGNSGDHRLVVDNTVPTVAIEMPTEGEVVAASSRLEITGSAADVNLQEYRLEFATEDAPDIWHEVAINQNTVSDGLLGAWNTLGLDGSLLLRLTATDRAGPAPNQATELRRFIVDGTPPEIEILQPMQDQLVSGVLEIRGTVVDEYLERYEVSIISLEDGQVKTQVSTRTQSILDSQLGAWDTAGEQGAFLVRVTVWDQAGRSHERTQRFEVDNEPPLVGWSSPAEGSQVRGSLVLSGTATDLHFQQYLLEYRPASSPGTNLSRADLNWIPITEKPVTQPVVDGSLATWHTQDQSGTYHLRLRATDLAGFERAVERTLVVPSPVNASTGGMAHDNRAQISLVIPPHALEQPTVITINQVPDEPTDESFVTYLIEPALRLPRIKPAMLELPMTDPPVREGIFRWDASAGVWRFLGGTRSEGRLVAPVTEFGRFQVRPVPTDAASGASLAELHCQPRVFSPVRGEQVAISFHLGEESAVDVYVFGGNGRLKRVVAEAQVLPPGGNVLLWDGTDQQSRPLSTGPYLVVVETETERLQQGVVVWNQ